MSYYFEIGTFFVQFPQNNLMKRLSLLGIWIGLLFSVSLAQPPMKYEDDGKIYVAVDSTGTPIFFFEPVTITAKAPTKKQVKRFEEKVIQFERLRRDIRIVYPYAKEASFLFRNIQKQLANCHSDKEKRKYFKTIEKELYDKYEKPLKNLTITQGQLLVKLIDRETGNTTYEIIKELKNTGSAVLWSVTAKFYGAKLDQKYDKEREWDIELAIWELETGKRVDILSYLPTQTYD
ncbi:MAG: DUF4294 domain-containing protein [Bacteroidia bacterium]|nr:DUF4294 domain-containing protein [Bacteroidia bacterium]